MKENNLWTTPLFQGITLQEGEAMLECLGARRRKFEKGERIYRAGDLVRELGVVLHGSVLI